MIEINFIRQKKRVAKNRAVVPLAAVAVAAVLSGFYMTFGNETEYAEPPAPADKRVVRQRTSVSLSSSNVVRKRKDLSKKSKPFRVAGFVSLAGRNFAMLVSSGRAARWVEEGQTLSGLKIADIKEEGIVAQSGSGAGETVFFPLKK